MKRHLPTSFAARFLLTAIVWGNAKVACGQNRLYVEHSGQARAVRDFAEDWPRVAVDRELVRANGRRLFLSKEEEYAPFSVSVRNFEVNYSYQEFVGDVFDDKLTIAARFESPYHLERVFFVLEFPRELAGRKLFAGEIGELLSYQEKSVTVSLKLNSAPSVRIYTSGARPETHVHTRSETDFVLHIFTDGFELFHSRMPPNVMSDALDQMVERRTRGADNTPAKKFIGPIPRYPSNLRAVGVAGEATLSFEISTGGRVVDAQIKSATKPEFGDASMQSISQWRFLPKIEKGHPVATSAELPFVFDPKSSK